MKKTLKILALFLLISVLSFAEGLKIDIVTFNDFHGQVKEGSKEIGMAKLVGYVDA
ncbi:MAG: hypothetical protein PWP46_1021, partial [Fusobacteriaceae bacterium]|nr:hypothetical protein [Fusobacteriales bacterium]MDN5304141.1 hypothetical protein [Fusobacteriaceae bacterium]